jgi:hypothetical protein
MTKESSPHSVKNETNLTKQERFDFGADRAGLEKLPELKSLLALYQNMFGDISPSSAFAQSNKEGFTLPADLQNNLFNLGKEAITEVIAKAPQLRDVKNLEKLQVLMRLKSEMHTKKVGELGETSGIFGAVKGIVRTTILRRDTKQEDLAMRASRAATYIEGRINEAKSELDQKYAV